ncbi:MAG: phage portal protein [Planctomycetaceae bacterium]|nr:phage portal protein [Planctomycetaceae bacterium]
MTDALTRAFAQADRFRESARKAVAPGVALVSSSGGGFARPLSLSNPLAQYEHGRKGWAYVAMRAIAQRIAGQDVFVGRLLPAPRAGRKSPLFRLPGSFKSFGDRLEPLESHPLLTALQSPNPLMVRWSLVNFTLMNLELAGRAFWWWSNGELWPLPASWIEPTDALRSGWRIRPAGLADPVTVGPDDVLIFSLPDPADPFGCLSPLQTQAAAVATDEAIQTAQHRTFENGSFPQLMIRAGRLPGTDGADGPPPVLTNEQRKQLVSAIKALYRGAVRYHEPLIVDGLIEGVDRLTDKPGEMDFLDSGRSVKSRILQAFGVNPLIVGEIEGANRAQATVAEESFCANTINPLIELLSQTLTAWAQRVFPDPVAVWFAPCEAHDSELDLKRWETAARLGYVTQNEYRRMVLNLPDAAGGDVFLDPLTGEPRKAASGVSRNGRVIV